MGMGMGKQNGLMQLKKYKIEYFKDVPWSTEIFINSKSIESEILNDSF